MESKTYYIFASHYFPYLGGVERYTYNMGKQLSVLGNKVIVITSSMKGQPDYEEMESMLIIRLPSFELLNGRFPVLKYNRHTHELLKKMENSFPADYVIINTRFYALSYFAVKYALKKNIPSIVIEHGTGHFTVYTPFFDFWGHIYEHFITYLVRRNCNRFYGVSQECNNWLQHFGIEAAGVLYNAIDIRQIEELYTEEEGNIKKDIDYQKGNIIITYTGRLVKEKGILLLIDAVNKIRKTYPNVKLCVAGDGDLYDELIENEYKGIYILGRLDFKEIIQLLKISKIYCLPTDYPEGLPTSVLEAIACKAYVITTRAGGSKEVIIDNRYGTILKENTKENLVNAIMYVIENEDKCQRAVKNAYTRLCNGFTWECTTNTLLNIFKKQYN